MKIDLNINKNFNKKYIEHLDNESRFLVFCSGSGTGKSHFCASKLIYRCIMEKNHRFMVIRKIARTIRHSCFNQILDIIRQFNLEAITEVNQSDLIIRFPILNSEVLFMGMDDSEKIKSLANCTGVWIEETTELEETDIKQISLRLRGKTPNYFQIMMSFNPISNSHWLKKFCEETDNLTFVKTKYEDNEYLDQQYKDYLESFKDKDDYFYQVYAKGEWGQLFGLIYQNWEMKDLSEMNYKNYCYGLDFGFSSHSAFIKINYDVENRIINVLDEIYIKNATIQQLAELIVPILHDTRAIIWADSADPRSIGTLKAMGFNCYGVKKGQDSKRHAIDFIRSHTINIDQKCINFKNEISSYRWKLDKYGKELPLPMDENDHLLDSLIYALENKIIRRGISLKEYEKTCDFLKGIGVI